MFTLRNTSLMILTLAAGPMLFGTNREATYTVGNLESIHSGATGTVHLDDNGLSFLTGSTVIQTPYANITSTELGAQGTHPVDVPAYKFWEIGKRLSNKTVYQNLLVNFKDSTGKEQTMTLEMTQPSAREIQNAVEARKQTPANAPAATAATHKEKKTAIHQKADASQPKADPQTVASSTPTTAAPEQKPEGWWGDQYWKTVRNQTTWTTQSAALGGR
jgi:hypothetical protein